MLITDGKSCVSDKCTNEYSDLREIMDVIEAGQKDLGEANGGTKANIFTFTVGSNGDNNIPRHISCANNGTWNEYHSLIILILKYMNV